jgi:sugar phosphate isomerase/epimerase
MTSSWAVALVATAFGEDIRAGIPRLVEAGVDSIEVLLPCLVPEGAPDDDAGICAAVLAAGIGVNSIHAPFGPEYDLAARSTKVRSKALAAHVAALDLCGMCGTDVMVVHAGHHTERGVEDEFTARALDSMRVLIPEAKQRKVRLAVENLPPDHLTPSAAALAAFIDEIDHPLVGACLDTGHAEFTGGAVAATELLGPRIMTVHAHDNDGTGDQHLMPGHGVIDWAGVGAALRAAGYARPIVLELRLPEGYTPARMKEEFRRLAGG